MLTKVCHACHSRCAPAIPAELVEFVAYSQVELPKGGEVATMDERSC